MRTPHYRLLALLALTAAAPRFAAATDPGGIYATDGGGIFSTDGGGIFSTDPGGIFSTDGGGIFSRDLSRLLPRGGYDLRLARTSLVSRYGSDLRVRVQVAAHGDAPAAAEVQIFRRTSTSWIDTGFHAIALDPRTGVGSVDVDLRRLLPAGVSDLRFEPTSYEDLPASGPALVVISGGFGNDSIPANDALVIRLR